MLKLIRKAIVLGLVLNLGHVPIPWAHTHETMDEQQLAEHVGAYHLGTGTNDVPQGWHMHVFCCGAIPVKPSGDGWNTPPCRQCWLHVGNRQIVIERHISEDFECAAGINDLDCSQSESPTALAFNVRPRVARFYNTGASARKHCCRMLSVMLL